MIKSVKFIFLLIAIVFFIRFGEPEIHEAIAIEHQYINNTEITFAPIDFSKSISLGAKNFATTPEKASEWSAANFPEIKVSHDDVQDIEKLNKELRIKYLNRVNLYPNQVYINQLDSLFITSTQEDIILYGYYTESDFQMKTNTIPYVYESMLKNTRYGIDNGYFVGSLTKREPVKKSNNELEKIVLKLLVPKGTQMIRVGSLSDSQYLLPRGSVFEYKNHDLMKTTGNIDYAQLEANITNIETLNNEAADLDSRLEKIISENIPNNVAFNFYTSSVGLNAGNIFASSTKVMDFIISSNSLQTIFKHDSPTREFYISFTDGQYVHTSFFDEEIKEMGETEKRTKFESEYSATLLGQTRAYNSYIIMYAGFGPTYNIYTEEPQQILEEFASIANHEFFHLATFNNDYFKDRKMLSEQTFSEKAKALKNEEENELARLLFSNYCKKTEEEFMAEAFKAKYYPIDEIRSDFPKKIPKTNRFLKNLYDFSPPTVPQHLKELETTGNSVKFTFDHSTDDTSVERYNIYKDGELIKHYETETINDLHSPTPGDNQEKIEVNIDGLDQVTEYEFRVTAMDEAKNESEKSEPLNLKTKDTEPPEIEGHLSASAIASSAAFVVLPNATDNVNVDTLKLTRKQDG